MSSVVPLGCACPQRLPLPCRRWAVALMLLIVGAYPPPSAAVLPAPIAESLQRHGLSSDGLSVYVQELGRETPAISYAADVARNPASTLKLLTTLVALEELGPAYAWRTEAYGHGRLHQDRLQGDLYLKGYGDPYLVQENFWRFLRALRQQGLRQIEGDLVLDQSYFAPEHENPADFDGRPTRAYNVLPRALLVNFQAVRLRLLPQPRGLRVVADPPVPIENRIRLQPRPCDDAGDDWTLRVSQAPRGATRLVFDGRYAADCGERELFRVVADGPAYVHSLFTTLWREQGGRLAGDVREGETPATAQLLATWHSPPLADVIRSINKYSNNVMTRQLLLTLAAERYGAPATTANGERAVQAWLEGRGLSFPELVLDNGAGLSRTARLSARHLAQVLEVAYRGPYMPEFISALPVSALDGTLKHRFGGELAGRLHLKTGSLNGVRSLAGYVLDTSGKRWIVVYVHNHPRANSAAGEAVQQELLQWIYRGGEAGATTATTAPSRNVRVAAEVPAPR